MKVTGYMNIYRSGYYHRKGKPNAFDRHAGDVYPTAELAVKDIHPKSHYIGTIPITWQEETMPHVNPPESEPVSLKFTRKEA